MGRVKAFGIHVKSMLESNRVFYVDSNENEANTEVNASKHCSEMSSVV